MAFSPPLTSSIRKAQTAVVCQLCEKDPKLKWKCLQCGLMMCQICRYKVHPKFASAEDHTIIDIKDIHQHHEEQKQDLTKLKCSDHTGQNCCLYCKPCSELVCPLCIAKIHNKHDLIEISEGYKTQLEKIKNKHKNIKEGIQNLSHGEEELRKIKFFEESSYKKSKLGILGYKQSLIKAIEKHCDELEGELDEKWSNIYKSMIDEEHRVKDTMETLIKQNDEVNSLCQCNDAMKVFSSKSSLKSMETNIRPVKTKFDLVPKFVPGDVTSVSILPGKLEKVTHSYNKDLTVVQQFQTECDFIDNLIVCPNDLFWINDSNLKVIQKVSLNRGYLQVKCKFSLYVNEISPTPSGDLLLSVHGSSVLKVIPSGTEEMKDSIYSVLPLLTLGVQVTKDNKVIIGAMDKGPYFPATGHRQVIILDQSGRQEKVFQFDINRKALFTVPTYITSNNCNNIGVVDWLSEDGKGRVLILDQYGGVKHIYSGHSKINGNNKPFEPYGIVSTPSDNFIIADPKNHTIHFLSSEGKIITYYNTEELGIKLPYSLSFSHTGQLYIGCGIYFNSDDKAMIYKMDNIMW